MQQGTDVEAGWRLQLKSATATAIRNQPQPFRGGEADAFRFTLLASIDSCIGLLV